MLATLRTCPRGPNKGPAAAAPCTGKAHTRRRAGGSVCSHLRARGAFFQEDPVTMATEGETRTIANVPLFSLGSAVRQTSAEQGQ